MNTRAARAYANAIFSGADVVSLQKTYDELKSLSDLIAENRELRLVVQGFVGTESQRAGVIDDIVKRLSPSDYTRRCLSVLQESGRLSGLKEVVRQLRGSISRLSKVQDLQVRSARTLNPDLRRKIEGTFEKLLQSPVQASYDVDPKLLGGVKVSVGGKTYDASVTGTLSALEETFLEAR